jgi:hypothetical protein
MSAKKSPTKSRSKKAAKKTGTGPVAQVWAICDKLPRATRKDVLAACEKAGINPATAVTQFYRWKKAKAGK